MKKGWEYKTLGEVCNVNYGTRVVRSKVSGTEYPVYGGGGETFRMDRYNRENCVVVARFAMSKQCTRFVKGKFFLNDSGLTVSPKEGVGLTIELLERCLIAYNDLIYSYGRGSAQRNLNMAEFRTMPISFPKDIAEQRRIVSYLDSSFDLIDKIKENASKSLSEAKALFQSALAEAMEPKEGWEEKTLGEICTFIRGPFGGSLKKECFKVEGYAVYEQQNAIYNRFNFRYFIDEIKYKEMSRFKVAANDLIMSCSGTIGKVAIIPKKFKEGIINQALLKLTPSNVIDSLFLKYLMESKVFNDQLLHFTEGVAIKNVASVAILKGINVNYPPLSTQKQIVSRLDSLSSKVRAIEEKYQKMIAECDALKQAMLREVFE